MTRHFPSRLALLTVAIAAIGTYGAWDRVASAATCAQWAVKPYRHCIRYAPSPTTTTTTTIAPETTLPDTSLCDLGSPERQQAHDDIVHYLGYTDSAPTVIFDATVFATVCAAVDPALAASAQQVVDCFNGATAPACALTPEQPQVFVAVGQFGVALVPPVDPDPTIPAGVDALCRENGPGRVHAIGDVQAYERTWAQAEADAVMLDATMFIAGCITYPGTGQLRADAAVLANCLAGWTGYLPQVNACYLPGNEISRYLHDLLVSSR